MDNIASLVAELKTSGSTNDKKEMLKKYQADSEVKEFLQYTLDPFRMFNMTSKNIKVNPGESNMFWPATRDALDQLQTRAVTGNAALQFVHSYLDGKKSEFQSLFLMAIDKDLRSGVGARLVNDVFDRLIPEFEVQLCEKWTDPETLPFKYTYCSRKLDGVRLIAICRSGKFRFYSREGKEFVSLDKLKVALEHYVATHPQAPKEDFILDGELCIVDANGKEDFSRAVSEIKRKNFQIENPKFILFDLYTYADFDRQEGPTKFADRYVYLQNFMAHAEFWSVLKQHQLSTPLELQRWSDLATEQGWEGLILRNGETPYEGKRTKNLLKMKKFHDHEFRIIGSNEGTKQFTGMLGALVIEGEFDEKKIVSEVGSGFKQSEGKEERQQLWARREELIGQIVTVRFFELSQDKEAKAAKSDIWSLRFPSFKILHGRERTT